MIDFWVALIDPFTGIVIINSGGSASNGWVPGLSALGGGLVAAAAAIGTTFVTQRSAAKREREQFKRQVLTDEMRELQKLSVPVLSFAMKSRWDAVSIEHLWELQSRLRLKPSIDAVDRLLDLIVARTVPGQSPDTATGRKLSGVAGELLYECTKEINLIRKELDLPPLHFLGRGQEPDHRKTGKPDG